MTAEPYALYDPATGIIRQTGRSDRYLADALAAQLGLVAYHGAVADQRTTRIVNGEPVEMEPVAASVDATSGSAPLTLHVLCSHPGFAVVARGEIDPAMPEWAWDQRWTAAAVLELTPDSTEVTLSEVGRYVLHVAVSTYSATRIGVEVTA